MNQSLKSLHLMSAVIMGTSPKGHTYNSMGEGMPLLNGPTEFGDSHPECTLFTNASVRECLPGDLIFCVRGSTTGRMNWADRVYSLGRGVCAIRGEDDLDTRFIRYGLEYRLPALLQLAGGSTFPNLPQDTIKDFEIPFPRNRKRIASILSAYDEAMENNRQRMGLLENAARLLYQEWFVRLRFPGHEHTPVIKDLPKGWEWKPLNAICPDLREAANPTDLEPGTPYIGLEHMPRRSITLLDWGTAEDVTSTKLRYLAGDILFGKIRPYFHKVGFALTDGVTSSDAIVLRPSEPLYYSFALLTVSSDWFVNIVSKTAKEGSKMPRADWNLMEMHSLVVPPRALLETLNETIKPMLDQLRTLALQNLKLRAARELLLPRLMSGEIEV